MSFFSILETLLIGPLKLVFEVLFDYANRITGHPGTAIVFLSLAMNLLVLPLYRRADAMQEASRDTEARLHDGVAHIKKSFSGDERMMMLQTYYRQNNYRPTDALHGSVSLLLEIPFFLAAYQFLSHLELLQGVAFGPIADLGAPDGLLVLGGLSINLLPLLMTAVNLISGAVYLKGFPLKAKAQLYAMALVFLVFLYGSPAALTFYWTLNNLFSLVKNIFYKLKHPGRVLSWLSAAAGAALLLFAVFLYRAGPLRRRVMIAGLGLALLLPLFLPLLKKLPLFRGEREPRPDRRLFWLGAAFLTVLVGLLIPSALLASSPQEFTDISYFYHPLWYLASSLSMAAGFFLVWLGVFYWLASLRGKCLFEKLIWVLCGGMLTDYMFFGTDLGLITSFLQFENGLEFSRTEQLVNLLVLAAAAAVLLLFSVKWRRAVKGLLAVALVSLSLMSARNLAVISSAVEEITPVVASGVRDPQLSLSKTGKNVVVLMLDRAMGQYIPYLFQEKPELEEQFDGFTYYDNVISFGGFTNFGSPALFGGYEYTPVEMNRRSELPLVEKQNEALKLLPALFSENGYAVTVCDPVYANYQAVPDLSIYDGYPGIKAYITKGWFNDPAEMELSIQNRHRSFFCYSLMKTMPLFLQPTIYGNSLYHQPDPYNAGGGIYVSQTMEGMSVSTGYKDAFMVSYRVLENMVEMTRFTDGGQGSVLLMTNDTPHEPMLLQEPDYVPALEVDNRAYDAEHSSRFTVNGRTLKVTSGYQMSHYQANMAALLRLGSWFDYLRENGVYDNTRIILASDHGQRLYQLDELNLGGEGKIDAGFYFPLLMVKDFDSQGFTVSSEFMTQADVPTLALEGLIEDPVNPFTGNPVSSSEKTAHEQYIIVSNDWSIAFNNGSTFLPAQWLSVKDSIWDKDNWTLYEDPMILAQNSIP